MAEITGTSAYSSFIRASHLRVAEDQPRLSSQRLAERQSTKRVVEDRVTLSDEAQKYLAQQARQAESPDLSPAALGHGNLIGADLAGKDFSGGSLEGIYLFGADLRDADFRDAYLKDAWLADSDVTGADFTGADLRGANLSRVSGLTREQLAGATIDLTTVLPVTVRTEG